MDDAAIARAITTARSTAGQLFRELSDTDNPVAAVQHLAAAVDQLGAAITELARRQGVDVPGPDLLG